jgi:2-O-methyltransferase
MSYKNYGLAILIALSYGRINFALISNAGPITKEYIKQYLPHNPIIVEAGAYDGADTEIMAKMWPAGKVYAFEPVPRLFERIVQKTKLLKNVQCFQLALGDKSGSLPFYVSEPWDASSSLAAPKEHIQIYPGVQFPRVINVDVKTLDQWAAENNVTRVDFLYLDMQGYEPAMLMASKKVLKTVRVIYTEVNTKELYANIILYPQLTQWLASQGFTLVREQVTHHYGGGDALYVRTRNI